jgi:hypothetical protein
MRSRSRASSARQGDPKTAREFHGFGRERIGDHVENRNKLLGLGERTAFSFVFAAEVGPRLPKLGKEFFP